MTAQPPPNYRPPPPAGYQQSGYQQPPPQGYGPQEYRKVFRGQMGSYLNYPHGENDKLWAGASYAAPLVLSFAGMYFMSWIVSLVALVAVKPQSPWLRFHAIQSLVLNLIILGIYLLGYITFMIAYILLFVVVGIFVLPFALLIIMAAFGISVYGLVIGILVLTGKDHRVPFLADWVEKNYV